ncbi:glycosyltransferase family 2 protein [Subtercola boreus]|uniref:Glycosyltransferase 2-like domain-containing protein n=1 Tax=Subtercola boreus TaxID=120213 RepID=A0A3E0W9L5_9MICO|nr:glycosyltransferase [Subtercola boreus]RFA19127.1 hypothetical protein B7R24_12910 [Subtercola boreus]RFA19246.1 hypothetical protein B7R23_12890 [Subtercola boreus]RFA25726.1 hypothetical protein B7R25_13010 [Subtercola boreus]
MTGGPRAGIPLPGNDWSLLDGVTPDEAPTVSVVVVHFEQQAELDRTLAALRRQTHPADRLQLIVVDDGSRTPPVVPADVRVLRQADLGFRASAARNLGAAAATGEVLCFLDADTAPEPGYVEAIIRLPALAPDVVTVGRRRHADFSDLPADAPVETVVGTAPEREYPSPEWLLSAYADSRDLLVSDDRSYRFVIGAVVACSRALFRATGGFDETFTTYGGEDWDWAFRAWNAGALLAHVPSAVAWHDGPEWAGRADDPGRMARKNAETLALAARIPVAGSRPLALRSSADVVAPLDPASAANPGAPGRTSGPQTDHAPGERTPTTDTVASIHSAPSLAALVLSVDTVLDALPGAVVRVPAEFADALAADARITPLGQPVLARLLIDVPVAARFDVAELRAAAERMTTDSLGSLDLLHGGDRVARLEAQRAVARETRWGRTDLFPHLTASCISMRIVGEPDLGAYFGGWG